MFPTEAVAAHFAQCRPFPFNGPSPISSPAFTISRVRNVVLKSLGLPPFLYSCKLKKRRKLQKVFFVQRQSVDFGTLKSKRRERKHRPRTSALNGLKGLLEKRRGGGGILQTLLRARVGEWVRMFVGTQSVEECSLVSSEEDEVKLHTLQPTITLVYMCKGEPFHSEKAARKVGHSSMEPFFVQYILLCSPFLFLCAPFSVNTRKCIKELPSPLCPFPR